MIVFRLSLLAGLVLAASPVFAQRDLVLPDLGDSQSHETVSTYAIASGVRYERIDKEDDKKRPNWFITFGISRDTISDEHLANCAVSIGLTPTELQFTWPGNGHSHYAETVAGAFSFRDAAVRYLAAHPQPASCKGRITASPIYPEMGSGPWRIHVVEIDPKVFSGGFRVAHGHKLATGRALSSAIAQEQGAVVAINGGYFVMEPGDGIIGESAGLSIDQGAYQSEPTRHRPWFLFPDPRRANAELKTSIEDITPMLEWSDGTVSPLDGVDRDPSLLRNCGSLRNAADQAASHDQTCRVSDQLVLITAESGFVPETRPSRFLAILGSDGSVRAAGTHKRGRGDRFLVATGKRRDVLSGKIAAHLSAHLMVPLLDRLPNANAVGGGPTLILNRKLVFDELREGWPFASATDTQANNMHRFVVLRAPRTAIGVRADGTVLLVVVDGWRFADERQSAVPLNGGASIDELRRIMLDLGAVQAMNLDGGGSSTLVIDGKVINQPSDPSGERAVGDAILLIPTVPNE